MTPDRHAAPSSSSERGWAAAAHAGALVVNLVVAAVVLLSQGRSSRFVRAHASEAVNFQLTLLLVGIIAAVSLGDAGPLVAVGVAVVGWAFSLAAAVQAGQGRHWRYPLALRVVRGDDRDADATPPSTEVATGASGPGEPGYEGRVTVGDEGAAVD